MALLHVDVPNPDELLTLYGAGSLIRWEWSADGLTSWTEGGTEPLVTLTYRYTIEHTTATAYYYRTRYSTASPSVSADYSGYSDVTVISTGLSGYATVAEVKRALSGIAGDAHDFTLSDLIESVSADIEVLCGRTFLRVPQVSGDVTVYVDIRNEGLDSLLDAAGSCYTTDGRALDIVSVTSLWYRTSETGSYTEVAAGDTGYYLEAGYGPGTAGTAWPYEDVTLSPASATRTTYPTGKRAVKIIGALGFPKVPASVGRATISEVAERFRQSIGGGPAQQGVNQFGTPIFLTGDSPDMRRLRTTGGPFVKRNWRMS